MSLVSAEMEKGHQLFTPTTKAELETQMSAQQHQTWFDFPYNDYEQTWTLSRSDVLLWQKKKTIHQVGVPPSEELRAWLCSKVFPGRQLKSTDNIQIVK